MSKGKKGTKISKKKAKDKPSIPPMDKDKLSAERKARNALNRERSKKMERDVAKMLGGNRVPMSGAHSQYKGDAIVHFATGSYLIECKLSAQKTKVGGKDTGKFRLEFAWLPKLVEEVIAMKAAKARWGILIFKFMGSTKHYVLMRHVDITKIVNTSLAEDAAKLKEYKAGAPILDLSMGTKGKPQMAYTLTQHQIDDILSTYPAINIKMPGEIGTYLLIGLDTYRNLVEVV